MKIFLLAGTFGILAAISASRAAQPATPYELTTCVVSGEKLGGMGTPIVRTYEGQEIKFCCASCVKAFDKDPAAGLKKYETALRAKSSGGANPAN